jgi:hypothetical protein
MLIKDDLSRNDSVSKYVVQVKTFFKASIFYIKRYHSVPLV